MRRIFALSLTSLILWAVLAQVNHALTDFRVYLFAGALFVSFTALTQTLRSGLTASIIGGLICDANSPVPFGTHVLLFTLAHVTVFHIRDRVPRDDNVAAVVLALFTNFALFLVFSFTQIHISPYPAAIWPRLLMDLLCSQILVAVITPWFFALQARALDFAGPARGETA
jgi:rod shape-determining protein MreD